VAAIELTNVVKTFGDGARALDGLNLQVNDGELLAVVGPSGCGKSTVLRVIAGLEQPNAGQVYIANELVNGCTPAERNIAMISQSYALHPHLTVYDNLAFPLTLIKGLSKRHIDASVRDVSRTLDLDAVLGRKPANLSGGERQRVAMGRALIRDARALLLDEPLANLDTQQRFMLRREATPTDLCRHPLNLFVAGFIGSPPMRFMPAIVRDGVVDLFFGWVRISGMKAARLSGREHFIAGARPETVRLEDIARTDHQYARIPPDISFEVPADVAEFEREFVGGGLPSTSRAATGFPDMLRRQSEDVYVNARSMHLFDPETGENITRDLD
jgi:multiple sugar transport system ATP-binding protein